MAKYFAERNMRTSSSASTTAVPTSPLEQEAQQALRTLKNRLQQRFADVKSSHLSEALASALGYNSNAALRADMPSKAFELAHAPLDVARLRERLLELGYPLRQDLSPVLPGTPSAPLLPPPDYLARLAELRRLQENPEHVGARIQRLRKECAEQFAQAHGLGRPWAVEDKSVVQRWHSGVDHTGCLPGWGDFVQPLQGGSLKFPGNDHVVTFYETLPLTASAKHCEYEHAMVSMPYASRMHLEPQLEKAALEAAHLGWTMSEHTAWSWYQTGETRLILFKRTATHEQLLADWKSSFIRWVLENRSRLLRGASTYRRMVIEDVIASQHLPWDLKDFEDCRERYLKEFARRLYLDREDIMAVELQKLMQQWDMAKTAVLQLEEISPRP